MKAILVFLAIALAVTVLILLRFIVKRVWLFAVLRKFAKKHGYVCKMPHSCLWPNNRNDSVVQLETGNTLYAVKLFGLLRKHCELHFWNTQEYSVEWYFSRYGYVGSPRIGQTNANHRRSLGKAVWKVTSEKEVIPVLLISPAHAPVRLTQTNVNHLEHLRAGEKIENVLFADLDYLLRFIEKQER